MAMAGRLVQRQIDHYRRLTCSLSVTRAYESVDPCPRPRAQYRLPDIRARYRGVL